MQMDKNVIITGLPFLVYFSRGILTVNVILNVIRCNDVLKLFQKPLHCQVYMTKYKITH